MLVVHYLITPEKKILVVTEAYAKTLEYFFYFIMDAVFALDAIYNQNTVSKYRIFKLNQYGRNL